MRLTRILSLQWGPAAVAGTVVPPRRKRQFVMKEGRGPCVSGSCGDENSNTERPPPHGSTSFASIPHRTSSGVARALSQREEYRAFKEEEEASMRRRGVPGEWLSPMPKRYGFYDGIDEHGYEAPRASKEERRAMLQAALERNAASVVEFTEGGEQDIDMGGLPESEYHGQAGWTTIPRESALYNNVMAREELDSRTRNNSWTMARQQQQRRSGVCSGADGEGAAPLGTDDSDSVIDDKRRRRRQDEGSYSSVFDGDLLEPNYESIGQPCSTYGLRKMFVAGFTGYQGIITKEEEARICDELMQLLQDRRAAYIAEETRYCVNLYEKELGIPGKDTLAFAMSRAPTLQRVLERFFHLGLIPSPPNICQVSEMIGNFSGYPVHKKPLTIGPYCGILNLVSTTVMYLQHLDSPWFPRVHVNPRSLFVVEQPCLGDYKMGYKRTHQPFHTFEYATRVSKDYRIEVMFATVEAAQMRYLKEAVGMTEYAERKQLSEGSPDQMTILPSPISSSQTSVLSGASDGVVPPFSGSTDKWLERLNHQMHASERDTEMGNKGTLVDGTALREQLLASGFIGAKPRPFEATAITAEANSGEVTEQQTGKMTPAQRRMTALKARYTFAKRLKEESGPWVSKEGVRVIEGHSPRKNTRI
ncbi:hypothetical protein DQ04_01991040 [Trypanosoma grayi]|uniref:hypothetical protein n=1 Tax=Trypanosoma grayi TaxID=71804 RepID=UPI0004F40E20|nr:hypothetical protein DQ04_01991040 [Trypanosoma grayi]KEG12115.1 hypothetical protein DQ04_01991040 [Trypanosoma grayi]